MEYKGTITKGNSHKGEKPWSIPEVPGLRSARHGGGFLGSI